MAFSKPRSGDRGAALVEMALVTPLLVILLLGIIDAGRLLFTWIPIQEAAQEGTIYASQNPGDYQAVRQRVVASVDSPTIDPANITVECPAGVGGDEIKVTVTYDVDLITPLMSQFFGGTMTLKGSETGGIFTNSSCDPSP